MKDIAAEAKCSVQVVSAILGNGKSHGIHCGKALGERVREIARRLNYTSPLRREVEASPSVQADVPPGGRRINLGFIYRSPKVVELSMPLFIETIGGMAGKWGFQCHNHFMVSGEPWKDIGEFVANNHIDGLMFFPVQEWDEAAASALNVPMVFYDPYFTLDHNCVLHGEEAAIGNLAVTLSSMGIQNLAYVGEAVRPGAHPSVEARRNALIRHAERNGMTLRLPERADKPPFEQLLEITQADISTPLLVMMYAAMPELIAAAPSLFAAKGLRTPEDVDFFSLDGDCDVCFGQLDLRRWTALSRCVENLLLMITTGVSLIGNIYIDESLMISRPGFSLCTKRSMR